MISIVKGKVEISLNLQGISRLHPPYSQPTNEGALVVGRSENGLSKLLVGGS